MGEKKIIFIPGWLDSGEIHGYKNSLAIWERPINFQEIIQADYLIGHSIGAALALHYWEQNNNLNIILFNPLLTKKKLFSRWIKSLIYEGTHLPWRRLRIMGHIFSGIFKLNILLRIDELAIIKKIPPEKILIIFGENDRYLGNEGEQILHKAGRATVKIDGVGHNWHERVDMVIAEYINHPTQTTN